MLYYIIKFKKTNCANDDFMKNEFGNTIIDYVKNTGNRSSRACKCIG